MQDTKKSDGVVLFLKSGREINFKKTLTQNYEQLINWLFSEDKIPFKVNGRDNIEKDQGNDFILYKESIEVIEIKK